MSIISQLKIYIYTKKYILKSWLSKKKVPYLALVISLLALFERKGKFILHIVPVDAKGGAFISWSHLTLRKDMINQTRNLISTGTTVWIN